MLRITPETTIEDLRAALLNLAEFPVSPLRTSHTDPLLDAWLERVAAGCV
jgi:hypothetical protein